MQIEKNKAERWWGGYIPEDKQKIKELMISKYVMKLNNYWDQNIFLSGNSTMSSPRTLKFSSISL